MVIKILEALIAIPKIAEYVKDMIAQITAWWVAQQDKKTIAQIADAASYAMNAKTDKERYEASERWRTAFTRSRN